MARNSNEDHVDRLRAQWAREVPSIDTGPMAVLGRINRIARLADAPIAAVMQAEGIDRGEFDVLASLRRAGAPFVLSPTEIYTQLMLSSGGLTSRLKRLQVKGLVERLSDERDGRSQLVRLSKEGQVLVERVFAEDMRVEAGLLAGLEGEVLDGLERGLRTLCRALEAAKR